MFCLVGRPINLTRPCARAPEHSLIDGMSDVLIHVDFNQELYVIQVKHFEHDPANILKLLVEVIVRVVVAIVVIVELVSTSRSSSSSSSCCSSSSSNNNRRSSSGIVVWRKK